MDIWSELSISAIAAQQERAALGAYSERVVHGLDRMRALDGEWWPFGGPDWARDDPRELALRRVVIEALHDQDVGLQEASRSRSRISLLIAGAVTVGFARAYVFWRWETFSPEVQDALRVGWFIALPLLVLVLAIVAIAVSRIGKRRYTIWTH